MAAKLSERQLGIIKRLGRETAMTDAEIADYPGVKCSASAVNNHLRGIRTSGTGLKYRTVAEVKASNVQHAKRSKERWA